MLAEMYTVGFDGIFTQKIKVEAQISKGLPSFSIVGLPDKTVSESRQRIKAVLSSIGVALPPENITINLSPADIPKEGSHFDLPIALALLAAMNIVNGDLFQDYIALGELSLSGNLVPIRGVLGASIYANDNDLKLICPIGNDMEAIYGSCEHILAVRNILELTTHFKNKDKLVSGAIKKDEYIPILGPLIYADYEDKFTARIKKNSTHTEISHVIGQQTAKRGLEIAAAGSHNLLMIGSPGAGKSMLAHCLSSLLPPMTKRESVETSLIYNVASKDYGNIIFERPFIAPHHTTSAPAIVGGGANANAGAITMAHNGILFLDELPEFRRDVLESLRQPLETGTTTVARAKKTNTYPARFQFIAAMNPCQCGYLNNEKNMCKSDPKTCNTKYMQKISGPLLDRIDIVLEVASLTSYELALSTKANMHGESSAVIAQRVQKARNVQEERYSRMKIDTTLNAHLSSNLLHEVCGLDKEAQAFLQKASEKFQLSARGYFRTLKVARTIADLAESENVDRHHISEALAYRLRI